MEGYLFHILPLIVTAANIIFNIFLIIIHRGVYKENSLLFYLLNAIILFCLSFFGYYNLTHNLFESLAISVLLLSVLFIIFYLGRNRVMVYNGPLHETVDIIERKLIDEGIKFNRVELDKVEDLLTIKIEDSKEYIDLRINKSWLNDNHKDSVKIIYKLKDRDPLLEEIMFELREKRLNRSFRKRVVFYFGLFIFLIAIIIYILNYLN